MPVTRFVTDASLDFVARRLRFLGYDVVTHRGARLEELFEAALREERTVLTLSGRHPGKFARVPVLRAVRGDAAGTVRAIASAHEPAGRPFSRCPACNVALRSRSLFEAHGEVPGRVTRSGKPLASCPACGKWYWPGTHVAHIVEWLSAATGREIAFPAPSESPPA